MKGFQRIARGFDQLRQEWGRLEGAKVMGGLLIYPVLLGIAWSVLAALRLAR